MPDETPYNPLDIDHLGESVADALLGRPILPLDGLGQFTGAGVYAVYDTGESAPFDAYAPLAGDNQNGLFTAPIYVGKAVPSGARKGKRATSAAGQALFKRLREHAQSIEEATNLDVADFHCRYLVVMDIWIPLGESLLIERYQPLWNVIVDGFGNHDPGRGRAQGQRPMWDTIHPGRPWAALLPAHRYSATEIMELIRAALAGVPVMMLPEDVQRAEADSDEA